MIFLIDDWWAFKYASVKTRTAAENVQRLKDMFGEPGAQNWFQWHTGEYKGPADATARWGYGDRKGKAKVIFFRHEADAMLASLTFPGRLVPKGTIFI